MTSAPYELVGLDNLRKTLAQNLVHTAYLTLWDRAIRDSEECLGRFDLDEESVSQHLVHRRAVERGEDPPAGDLPAVRVTRREIVEAATRWVYESVVANTGDEPMHRFRVRFQTQKGQRTQTSVSITCHNAAATALEVIPVAPVAKLPKANTEGIRDDMTVSEARVLAELYTHWAQLVLGTSQQLHGVTSHTIGQLQRQLSDSRDQVDQLVASILESRAEAARAEYDRAANKQEADTRTALARDALRQLGEATRAFFSAKGLPPEVSDLLGTVSQNPELMAALNDPDVRAMMNEPDNLKHLAAMIRGASQQARMLRDTTKS